MVNTLQPLTFTLSRAKVLSAACLSALVSVNVYADEVEPSGPPLGWSFGAAVISNDLSYRGVDSDVIVVPAVGYEGEDYFIRGLTAGRHLYRDRTHQVWAMINLDLSRFKPSESSDAAMAQLDARDRSANIGIGYRYSPNRWVMVSANANTDITGRHNGQRAQLQYSLPLNRPMQAWQISPQIGVNYMSKDYVDYYFGISETEAGRSGLPAYTGKHSVNPFIGISGYQYFTEHLSFAAGYQYARTASGIADSPMATQRSYRTIFATILYRW
ncbi:MipA/OmpV family protein [Aliidiomarina indica]|uniref:MipA/OmpV family protein n=1 Tax=Aliidiomarina indica TaxID=2749147 RepID=UPI00188FAC28|nr:MipA/OmpV family protein [Aliidiomarina indica]